MRNFILEKDFNFTKDVFESFFAEEHVQKRLCEIQSWDVTGWEVWLQVELFIFMKNLGNIEGCEREVPYKSDGRKERKRKSMTIDFVIRKKHNHSSIAIELKQNNCFTTCTREMMKDVDKVCKVRESEDDTRTLWNVGVYRSNGCLSDDKDKVLKAAKKADVELACFKRKTLIHVGNVGANHRFVIF